MPGRLPGAAPCRVVGVAEDALPAAQLLGVGVARAAPHIGAVRWGPARGQESASVRSAHRPRPLAAAVHLPGRGARCTGLRVVRGGGTGPSGQTDQPTARPQWPAEG